MELIHVDEYLLLPEFIMNNDCIALNGKVSNWNVSKTFAARIVSRRERSET